MPLYIRPALPIDQDAIVGLVRSERLNPNGINWPNFLVATENDRLIDAVQLRQRKSSALWWSKGAAAAGAWAHASSRP